MTKLFEVYLPVNLTMEPQIINMSANGDVTAFVSLPSQYPTPPISGSVALNGIEAEQENLTNPQHLIFKFNRSRLGTVIPRGENIPVTLMGYTGNYYIKGTSSVMVR